MTKKYTRVSDRQYPKGTGRPPMFATPEQLRDAFNEYVAKSLENDDYISKEGFSLSYGFHKCLYEAYKNKENFAEVLRYIHNYCRNHLLTLGLKNKYNPTIVKLIASASYGMSEKTIQDGTVTNVNLSYDDYKKKLAEEKRKAKEAKNK